MPRFFGGLFHLQKKAKEHERLGEAYSNGAKGEGAIFHEFVDRLPPEFKWIQNVYVPRFGDVDFVVAGPTGVFAIEVKRWQGRISWNGERFCQNGMPVENDAVMQAMRGAFSVRRLLLQKLGREIFVRPIIVFVTSHLDIEEPEIKKVRIATKWNICKILQAYPAYSVRAEEVIETLHALRAEQAEVKLVKAGAIGGHVNLCKHIADMDIHEV